MAKKKRIDVSGSGELTHNPFAALRKGMSDGAAPPPVGEPEPEPEPETETKPEPRTRVVVRREMKGRAGKTVTRVSGLELAEGQLTELARDMKRALGCGASTEGDDLLLQGALTERAASFLESRGWSVTIGN